MVFGHPRHDRGKICLWWPQIAPDGLVLALPDATGDSACVPLHQQSSVYGRALLNPKGGGSGSGGS